MINIRENGNKASFIFTAMIDYHDYSTLNATHDTRSLRYYRNYAVVGAETEIREVEHCISPQRRFSGVL